MKNIESIIELIDLIANEYGWSIEYILGLDIVLLKNIQKVIIKRKRRDLSIHAKTMGAAVAAGFSGKLDKLDKLYREDDEPEQESDLGALKELWKKLKKNPADLEKQMKEGKVVL